MTRKISQKVLLEAIRGSGGIYSTISRRLAIDWSTARIKVEADPVTKQAYEDECERVLDLAEATIIKSVEGGDTSDAKWLLARKGKKRGYADNSQVDLTNSDGNLKPPQIIEIVRTYEKTDNATD